MWRMSSANSAYELCDSYPRALCVPRSITDEELRVVAQFRKNERLPVLTWYSRDTGGCIMRSSQPKVSLSGLVLFLVGWSQSSFFCFVSFALLFVAQVGFLGHSSAEDQKLLRAVAEMYEPVECPSSSSSAGPSNAADKDTSSYSSSSSSSSSARAPASRSSSSPAMMHIYDLRPTINAAANRYFGSSSPDPFVLLFLVL